MKVRIAFTALLLGALASTASAQDTTQHKPGGLNKVASNVHHTLKKAGNDTKAEAKRASSSTHHALKVNGNHAKAEMKQATGYTTPAPSPEHKPGGLNKVARDISHAGKTTGAEAKHAAKDAGTDIHHASTKAGNQTKAAIDTTIKH